MYNRPNLIPCVVETKISSLCMRVYDNDDRFHLAFLISFEISRYKNDRIALSFKGQTTKDNLFNSISFASISVSDEFQTIKIFT